MSAALYVFDVLATDCIRINGVVLDLEPGDILTLQRPVPAKLRARVGRPRLPDDMIEANRVAARARMNEARNSKRRAATMRRQEKRGALVVPKTAHQKQEAKRAKWRAKYARKKARKAAAKEAGQ